MIKVCFPRCLPAPPIPAPTPDPQSAWGLVFKRLGSRHCDRPVPDSVTLGFGLTRQGTGTWKLPTTPTGKLFPCAPQSPDFEPKWAEICFVVKQGQCYVVTFLCGDPGWPLLSWCLGLCARVHRTRSLLGSAPAALPAPARLAWLVIFPEHDGTPAGHTTRLIVFK